MFAMQATFVLNGRHVFKGLDRARLTGQWTGYMATNGFGNLCNYWIFVTLVSLHAPLVSNPFFALSVGAAFAWTINYITTRYLVFGPGLTKLLRRIRGRDGPRAAGRPASSTTPATVERPPLG
jgi:putative flippase GtrA